MPKQQITPITKEEMNRLMEVIEKSNEFDFMLFSVLKSTGRRIGELFGIEERIEKGRKIVGKRKVYIDGKPLEVDKTIPIYKNSGSWIYGVKLKDIDLERGTMKVWVLKRRKYIQDETILPGEVVRIIGSYSRKNRLKLEDYLFRRTGRGLRQINNVIKSYAEKAEIKHPVTTHNFRHYFITELRRKGWANEDIRVLTGHKAVGSLASYEHIVANDLKDRILQDLRDL